MRRRLSAAFAVSLAAALVAPTAQAATRSYYFQGTGPEQARIQVTVVYKNKQRHGRYTPRGVFYDASVPISCNPPVAPGAAAESVGPNPFAPAQPIKLRKGKFNYSYTYEIPSSTPPATTSGIATGEVIKKKRVEGSVSILDHNSPPSFLNCTSGGPIPYSATQCRQPFNRPSYIKPSLPVC
jgi:hypothetical protein